MLVCSQEITNLIEKDKGMELKEIHNDLPDFPTAEEIKYVDRVYAYDQMPRDVRIRLIQMFNRMLLNEARLVGALKKIEWAIDGIGYPDNWSMCAICGGFKPDHKKDCFYLELNKDASKD